MHWCDDKDWEQLDPLKEAAPAYGSLNVFSSAGEFYEFNTPECWGLRKRKSMLLKVLAGSFYLVSRV